MVLAGYSQLRVRMTFIPAAVGEFSYKVAVTNMKDQNNFQFIRVDASVLTQLDEVHVPSFFFYSLTRYLQEIYLLGLP